MANKIVNYSQVIFIKHIFKTTTIVYVICSDFPSLKKRTRLSTTSFLTIQKYDKVLSFKGVLQIFFTLLNIRRHRQKIILRIEEEFPKVLYYLSYNYSVYKEA